MRDSAVVYNKNVSISGTTTFSWSTQFYHNSFSGVLSGAGTLVKNDSNGILTFSNAANTFTGAIRLDAGSGGLVVNSLADSANAITFNGNTGALALGAGTASSLLFDIGGRQIVLAHANGGEIANNNGSASNTITINTNLGFSGAGTRLLELGGTNVGANAFNGNITNNGGDAVSVTKSGTGTWALGGTNTYSGDTNLAAASGTLIFQGGQSLSANTTLKFAQSSSSVASVRFLDDGAIPGIINFNRPIEFGGTNTGQVLSIFVGNNNTVNGGSSAGATIDRTIQVGNITHTSLAADTNNLTLNATSTNGYRLQTGTITLNNLVSRTAGQTTAYILNPTSANMTVAAVTMAAGNAGAGADGIPILRLAGTSLDNYVTGAISNSVTVGAEAVRLEKTSTSIWTLEGTNTYTGTTTVSGGKLLLSSTGSLDAGSAVTVSGGALGGTGAVNGAVTVSSTGGINLADGSIGNLTLGSTLNITGAAGANNLTFDLGNTTGTSDSLTVTGATTVDISGAAVISLNQLGGSAGRSATTYTLIGGAGTLDATNFALATTAAYGQTYALTNTGNDLQAVATNASAVTPTAFWSGTTNVWSTASNWKDDLAGSALAVVPDYSTNVTFSATGAGNLSNQMDADFNINSLTLTNASGNVTIASTAAKMLTLEASGGTGIDSQKTSGTNTISAKVGLASSQTWTVATSGTLAVSGAITDFGAGHVLTKAGGGNLSLTGATTYTGGTSITGGTLTVAAASVGAFNAGPLTLSGGGRLTLSGVNVVSASQVSVGSGGGSILVNKNNNFTTSGILTGSGTLTLADGGGSGTPSTYNFNSISNDFTGGIVANNAILNVNSLTDSGNNIVFNSTLATGVVANNVGLKYGSTAINPLTLTNRAIEFNSAVTSNVLIQNNNTTKAISIGSNLVATGAGAKTLMLDAVAGPSNVFSGTITDGTGGGTIAVAKSGAGDWSLSNASNSFTGAITVNAGTLAYASAGGANGISFTNTNTSVTLSYTGSGQTMSGAINAATVTSGTVNLVASGAGAINYSNTASLGSTGALVKNLVLSGTNTDNNTLAGAWVNNGTGAATLTKNGTGKWVLSANNTYTGATNVNAGTLIINGNQSSAVGATTVAFDAALGGDGTVGGSATFNDSSIFAWSLSVTDPSNTLSATVADTFAVTGNLVDSQAAGGSVFKIVLAGTQTFADTFWTANQSWSSVLTSGNSLALETLFTSFSYENGSGTIAGPTGGSSFSLSGSTLNYTAIPEPTSALAGLLLGAGLLRRRRNVGC